MEGLFLGDVQSMYVYQHSIPSTLHSQFSLFVHKVFHKIPLHIPTDLLKRPHLSDTNFSQQWCPAPSSSVLLMLKSSRYHLEHLSQGLL